MNLKGLLMGSGDKLNASQWTAMLYHRKRRVARAGAGAAQFKPKPTIGLTMSAKLKVGP
jgi:hypothetical protein